MRVAGLDSRCSGREKRACCIQPVLQGLVGKGLTACICVVSTRQQGSFEFWGLLGTRTSVRNLGIAEGLA